jgi:hypothetical protein
MNDTILTIEIAKRILFDVGSFPKANFGKYGISLDKFRLPKDLKVDYDGKVVHHTTYGGKLTIQNSNVYGVMFNLSLDEEGCDFIFCFRMDDQPIHCVNLTQDKEENEIAFIKIKSKDRWIDCTVYMQAIVLSGFERINDLGVVWDSIEQEKELNKINDLYKECSDLISAL